ncbi:MAG: hypothetical protein FWD00_01565 [Clostridiales bacterium]|nr:hypothetical protein [Clostridiales bacterium]
MNTIIELAPRRRRGFVAVATAACMLLITGSVFAAATLGVFDRFMEERDPRFGQVVTSVEKYVIDQGIRVDLIAAQSFDNSAILYLSVRDVSGQNRVTENLSISPHLDTVHDDTRLGWASISGGQEMMYFDNETQTAYFEILIQGGMPIADVMNVMLKEIVFERSGKEIDFPIALSNMTAAPLIPNPNYITDSQFPTWCPEYILAPSRGENFPAIPGDGWISNVAIVDGQLRVQIAMPHRTEAVHGMNAVLISGVSLTAANGDFIIPVNQTWLQVDAGLQTPSNAERQNMTQDEFAKWAETISYSFMEVVFPIDVRALNSYSLTLLGGVHSSIAGDWSMSVYTGDSSDNIRIMSGTVRKGNALIESVAVSPLGVSFTGTIDGGIDAGVASFTGSAVWLETSQGNILVQEFPGVGFSTMFDDNGTPEDTTFDGFARSDSLIDVSAVTAVIIGDVRIAVE